MGSGTCFQALSACQQMCHNFDSVLDTAGGGGKRRSANSPSKSFSGYVCEAQLKRVNIFEGQG